MSLGPSISPGFFVKEVEGYETAYEEMWTEKWGMKSSVEEVGSSEYSSLLRICGEQVWFQKIYLSQDSSEETYVEVVEIRDQMKALSYAGTMQKKKQTDSTSAQWYWLWTSYDDRYFVQDLNPYQPFMESMLQENNECMAMKFECLEMLPDEPHLLNAFCMVKEEDQSVF